MTTKFGFPKRFLQLCNKIRDNILIYNKICHSDSHKEEVFENYI